MPFQNISNLMKDKKGEDEGNLGTGARTPSVSVGASRDSVAEKFSKKMTDVNIKEMETDAMRFAASIGYPHIDLEKFPVSHEALRQIPREDAERLGAVCFFAMQDEIRIGALDPSVEEVKQLLFEVQERAHASGSLYVISEKSLKRVLRLYDTLPVVKPITKDIEIKASDLDRVSATVDDFRALANLVNGKSVSEILTLLIGGALKVEASDIHFESEEEGLAIRYRLDGILHDVMKLPVAMASKLISRIKLISSLKLNIVDAPQDGRFTIKKAALGNIDVRVSIMPSVYGESVVLRLLPQNKSGISLENVGLRGEAYDILLREIQRPNGMIITTGPTGSGKTTTMYAAMQILNKPGVKIITLEDPVEYKMEGVIQSQIDRSKDYTFAKGLRSILRQDPDIAMVGEIRDLETAEIAIQSALTGHLILSTIHTNSAAGAIPRFLSMGVKPFLLAPALDCVIGQRLVRRICKECRYEVEPSAEQKLRVEKAFADLPEKEKARLQGKEIKFFEGKGCKVCNGIGYKGRTSIYEVFVMTPEVEQVILSGQVSEYDINNLAIKNGMVTMFQDGILKAIDGITSVAEVMRVIG
ncbi:MAG TPA: GspE/PulE family protein [Candidatus Magasanikbacteria bacterium]|nr:GspE/PulE family protein [Candidatus Magasanikbacteria bacterium]